MRYLGISEKNFWFNGTSLSVPFLTVFVQIELFFTWPKGYTYTLFISFVLFLSVFEFFLLFLHGVRGLIWPKTRNRKINFYQGYAISRYIEFAITFLFGFRLLFGLLFLFLDIVFVGQWDDVDCWARSRLRAANSKILLGGWYSIVFYMYYIEALLIKRKKQWFRALNENVYKRNTSLLVHWLKLGEG